MLSKLCVGRASIVGRYENSCNGFSSPTFDLICKAVWSPLCKYYDNISRFFLVLLFIYDLFWYFHFGGKNKPAMSHQAVNLLYDYVTLWEEKKIMLARCCPINIVFLRMHYWIMMQMVHLHTCNMHTPAAHAPCLHFISWKKKFEGWIIHL